MSNVDGATLTDDERAYLRAAATLLAAIAEATEIAPGMNNRNIAELLGWGWERAKRVARGLRRTGVMAKSSHIEEQIRSAREASVRARSESP